MRSSARGLSFLVILTLAVLFLGSTGAAAQTAPAVISGSVQGGDGSPLAGTTVLAKNVASGRSHSTRTDSKGQFQFRDLSPGRYELQLSHPGFGSQTEQARELSAGQILTLNIVLEPASEKETVNRISESQLAGLPLNGRSYSQLATLQAGITDPTAASGSRGISGGSLTVVGGRSASNNFLLDGTNIMDSENQAPRSAAGVQLGSDAVFQVQVFSPNYGAEYGRGSGGVLNSITRSGSNEFNGTFLEFLRNSKLDARNFFDKDPKNPTVRSDPPPFKRNQFGFTVTGPLIRERTFIMVGYEGLRDRLTKTNLSYFPDKNARLGEITNDPGLPPTKIAVNSRVEPYLKLYPIPNDIPLRGGIGRNFAPLFLPADEDFFTIRLDQKISERDSLFARYTFDDAQTHNEEDTHLFTTLSQTRQQYLTVAGSHLFSLSALDSFRFGYTHPVSQLSNIALIEIPRELFFVPGASQFGQIQVPGLSHFGPNQSWPKTDAMTSFQFANDLIVQRGAHALKFGLQLHRYRWDPFGLWQEGGLWTFNSLESFLQAGPVGTSLKVALPGSDNRRALGQTFAGFYAQDEYQVSPRLKLNLGLRYEFVTQMSDDLNRIVFLRDPMRDAEMQLGSYFQDNPSLRSFAPRLGFSWSPWENRNTVLGGGFGIYYDQIIGYAVLPLKSSVPYYKIVFNPNFDASQSPGFPDAIGSAAGVPLQAQILDHLGTKTPMVLRYNFSLQQQLAGGWRIQASYVGARGNHLFRRHEKNLYPVTEVRSDGSVFLPPNSGPLNPAFGAMSFLGTDAQSFYNALQLSANKSLGGGLSLQASYSYSKSVDDSTIGHGSNFGQYPLMRTLDRGLSDFDIRQRLVVNYFYTLPFGSGQRWGQSGLLSRIVGGWRLGGILTMRSGVPFTPTLRLRYKDYLFEATRPNLAPGQNHNPVSGTSSGCGQIASGTQLEAPDLYFDPCVFEPPPAGTIGNLGRNTVISPPVFNLDVSFQREFLLDSKRRLQFRADIFNLPNHTNFNKNTASSLIIFSGLSGGSARRNSTAGRIQETATTSRQIQFALRFSF
ncbi:MAG: TonB-dependent receptor [Acidobacteria bacterium]|nr:TonB-dependent receptor [Acidobacteriota bacterium]